MQKKARRYIWLSSGIFILLSAIFCYFEQFLFLLLPVALLITLMAITSIKTTFWVTLFATPLSVGLSTFLPSLGVDLSLPSEGLLLIITLLFVWQLLMGRHQLKSLWNHPLTVILMLILLWQFITCFTSTMPVVSFKTLLAQLWFIVPSFFLGFLILKDHVSIKTFFWLYILGLTIVIAYTNLRLARYGLSNQQASNWVVKPFFPDHTSYGAMLVFFFFPLVAMIRHAEHPIEKVGGYILLGVYLFAIVLSYTRAAWLSMAAGMGIFLIFYFRIPRKLIITGIVGVFFFLTVALPTLQRSLEQNQAESSGNLLEHVQSMANVSSDASNMERINRWKCAIRMFLEKPITGWGPGTYMFQYAPFQHSADRTIISTNFGNLGNAHSEYLGPLAEQGILGLLLRLTWVIVTFYFAVTTYHRMPKGKDKDLLLAIILSLASYYIHGILNNFMDTLKAAVPIYVLTVIIVRYNIKLVSNETN